MKNSLSKKIVASAMVFGIAATAFSTQSFASTTSTTVSGGSLSGGAITFADLSATLNGALVKSTANWAISDISDARGTGAGWNMSMSLTQFKEVDGTGSYVAGGKSLATNSLKVSTVPTVAKKDTTSSDTTTITAVPLGTALDNGASVKVLSASLDGGMGSYTFGNLGVELTLPANAYAKTYKTDATVSINTAP